VVEDEASEDVDGDFVVGAPVPEDPDPLSVASVALETSLSSELVLLLASSVCLTGTVVALVAVVVSPASDCVATSELEDEVQAPDDAVLLPADSVVSDIVSDVLVISLSSEVKILLVASLSEVVIGTDG